MARTELEPWPICRVKDCGDEFQPARAALGYTTCFIHSHLDPMNAIPPLVLQDVNKSNPTITRNPNGLVSEPYALRPARSELRQTRAYIRLDAKDKKYGREE